MAGSEDPAYSLPNLEIRQTLYFSIGTPTMLPHSVQLPS